MSDVARARLRRVEGYSKWIEDDVDGLTAALKGDMPTDATATLAEARAQVALALSRLDLAIAADREAHKEHA